MFQLVWVSIWAAFWYVSMPWLADKAVKPYIRAAPWGKQWLALQRKTMLKATNIEFPDEDSAMMVFAGNAVVLLQHAVGGDIRSIYDRAHNAY